MFQYLNVFLEVKLHNWGWQWRFESRPEHHPERRQRHAFHGLIKLICVSVVLTDTEIMSVFTEITITHAVCLKTGFNSLHNASKQTKYSIKFAFNLVAINVFWKEIRYSENKILPAFIYAIFMSLSVFSHSLKLLVLHHKINNSDDRERPIKVRKENIQSPITHAQSGIFFLALLDKY